MNRTGLVFEKEAGDNLSSYLHRQKIQSVSL